MVRHGRRQSVLGSCRNILAKLKSQQIESLRDEIQVSHPSEALHSFLDSGLVPECMLSTTSNKVLMCPPLAALLTTGCDLSHLP